MMCLRLLLLPVGNGLTKLCRFGCCPARKSARSFIPSLRLVKKKAQGVTRMLLSHEGDTRKQEACTQRKPGVYYGHERQRSGEGKGDVVERAVVCGGHEVVPEP